MHGDEIDALPHRTGEPPRTGPSITHVQLTQNGPKEMSDRLAEWITAELPGVRSGPSEISDPPKMRAFLVSVFPNVDLPHDLPDEKATAFFVDGSPPAGVLLMPPNGASEFAHIHPDGSLHLALAPADQEVVVTRGWGERHPFFGDRVNVTMLYSPRNEMELDVAKAVVHAAFRYATGS